MIVLQNNKGNRYSTTVIIAPISSRLTKNPLPTHVMVDCSSLEKKSVVLLEQIRTIDKQRIKEKVGMIDSEVMNLSIKQLRQAWILNSFFESNLL